MWPEDHMRKDFWRYNQRTEKWVQVADFEGGTRESASSFVIGNNAYLGFGRSSEYGFGPDQFRRDLWKFTPSNQPPIAAGFVMMNYYPNAHLLNAWGSYDPEGGAVKFFFGRKPAVLHNTRYFMKMHPLLLSQILLPALIPSNLQSPTRKAQPQQQM